MRRIIETLVDLRPAFIGGASATLSNVLEGLNALIAIAVGLATLIYLAIRIRRELGD